MTRDLERKHVCRFSLFVLQNCLMVVIVFLVIYLSWVISVHHGLVQSEKTGNNLIEHSKENSTKRIDDEDTLTDVAWTDNGTTLVPAFHTQNSEHRSYKLKTRNHERKRKRGRKRIRNRKRLNKKKLVTSVATSEVLTGKLLRHEGEGADVDDGEANVAGRKVSSGRHTVAALSLKNVIKPRKEDIDGTDTDSDVTESSYKDITKSADSDVTKSIEKDVTTTEKNIIAVDKTKWSVWGSCSITCGVGQQERVRSCGSHCQEIETKPCLSQPCAGNGDDKWLDKWAYFEMLDMTTDVDLDTKARDPCDRWMKCSNKSIHHYLTKIAELPSCPCVYPVSLAVNDELYDDDYQKNFVWEDASDNSERNDVYRPGATFCIRSLLPEHAFTLAAQHCCYDSHHRLITRGRDAGTPNLVSPQISRELHKKVDILPWVMCKGDWTRYDLVLNPNNKRQCAENPCMDVIQEQIRQAKLY